MIALGFFIARGRARADGVVTDCSNDSDFTTQLANGGNITFDCGPNPVTIILNGEKSITTDTTVDGGNKVTLSGGNANRLFNIAGDIVQLQDIVLTNGFANGDGGAIVSNANELDLEHVTIQNSGTDPGHSGGAIVSYGMVVVDDSEIANNKAGNGGAFYPRFPGAPLNINNSSVHDNQTTNTTDGWGGAVLVWDGAHVSVDGSEMYNNTAQYGGAIYNAFADSEADIRDSTIRDNRASSQRAGGIYSANGSLFIDESTISGNSSFFLAGGIYVDQGSVELTNSTVTGNQAETDFGGLVVYSGATDLTNVTMSGDSPDEITAGSGPSGHLNLTNVIVAGSTGANCSFSTPPNASLFNLSTDATCNFGAGRDSIADMGLGPLADNGGPTLTEALLGGSPAIDTGTGAGCPSTDQRGAPRPFGTACDVGAVEYGATLATPTLSPSPTRSPTPTPAPTHSPTPTATPTHSPTRSPTPTPTPSPSGADHWGDNDCGGTVNLGDAIAIARKLVALSVNQQQGCPPLGDAATVNGVARTWGDIDCGGTLSLGDAIGIARFLVGLPVNQASGCPHIGDQVTVSG